MALSVSTLKNALLPVMQNPPATVSECAQAWADAYEAYAQGATSCQGFGPVTLVAAKLALKTALQAAFVSGTDPVTTALQMANAYTAFWLTPPVAFLGATAGAVVSVAGTGALSAGFVTQWAANVASSADADTAAQSMAALLDTFTKTVLVQHAAPAACSGTLL